MVNYFSNMKKKFCIKNEVVLIVSLKKESPVQRHV